MIINDIILKYQCQKCLYSIVHSPNTKNKMVTLETLPLIISSQTSKICHACCSIMVLKHVYCKRLGNADETFGNQKVGCWFCPKHSLDRYYPHALKLLWHNPDCSTMTRPADYRKVIENKFPWKCPKCNTELLYVEE